ncbi:M23 family metallopeptidase [Streptomyces sp. NPDC087917]|uniref:M23 family metallopeptidase n=1 Tax=unclassified Streptomyces TaxID=2593676 RepID=UPI0034437796
MGYDGLSTTTFAGDQAYVSYETQGQGYQYATDYAPQSAYDQAPYGTYAYGADTGSYDTTAWTGQQPHLAAVPAQTGSGDTSGQGDTGAWGVPVDTDFQSSGFSYDPAAAAPTGQWNFAGYGQDTGTYDASAWNGGGESSGYAYEATTVVPAYSEPVEATASSDTTASSYDASYDASAYEPTATFASFEAMETSVISAVDPYADAYADDETSVFEPLAEGGTPEGQVHDLPTQAMAATPAGPSAPRSARRSSGKPAGNANSGSRRRTPAKRSALLTVAVPSACVMGVAGVAAASVGGLTGTDQPTEQTTTVASAADPASIKPVAANNKLDTQLAALSADADNFADRASRTQERIDLRQRQDEEKKKKAEEAAAKEAARPKFAIPVAQHGLSAGFGQAGGMWMSVHTGIDFPVSYGTPVMAATDGTVRTQWNSAYGNMALVTSPDGTETWYCHLSSTKIRSGKVKAGEVIAYSGNSGNSTGPHLHFEVRPGAGAAIDPAAWLRNHGLDPT